ncbi:MAG TPA: hypothetical protein VJ385_13770 [Fibrobacteria bacterium]|nr:hypothetical protein [Fibrobacteria bacterium]
MWHSIFACLTAFSTLSALSMPALAGVVIDGNESDWTSQGSNRWFDPHNDAGGGSRDFTHFKISSDANNLYLYVKFAQQFGSNPYPEITFQIDKDARASTGKDGYETKLIIAGASSDSPCQGGCVRKIQYDAAGNVSNDTWLSSGWAPSAPNHGKDFLELSVPLSAMGLTANGSFRYFMTSRQFWAGSGGDWLGENTDPLNSRLRYYPASFPFAQSRPILIDGADMDWRMQHNIILDQPDDAGGATRDLVSAGIASDAVNLYFNARFQKAYGAGPYPEITLFIDKDLNSATGKSGYELEILMAGAAADNSCLGGCVKRTEYAANGTVAKTGWVAYPMQPNYPGHSLDFLEASMPLADLGLSATQRIRYILSTRQFWVGSGGDWLRNYATIASSRLYHTLSETMSIDGLEDDWKNVRTQWLDPKGDVGGATRDITGFSLASDAAKLYVRINMAAQFGASEYPEIQFYLDTDRDSTTGLNGYEAALTIAGASTNSPCTGGCVRRVLYNVGGSVIGDTWLSGGWFPNAPSHDLDVIELALPLSTLNLTAASTFRFFVYSRRFYPGNGGDYLQGQASIATSRLEYPKEALQIGVIASLDPATLTEVKDTLMAGSAFMKGKYFDTRLAIHNDAGLDLNATASFDAQNKFSYDFSQFTANMQAVKNSGLAIAPLINFHYLPGWFESKSVEIFKKDPRMIDAAGNPTTSSFLKFLPYCDGFKVWGKDMSVKAAQEIKKYLGDQISEVTIGNEPAYDNKDVGYDAAYTLPLWQVEHPGQPAPKPADGPFKTFRSRLLIKALGSWMDGPEAEFAGRVPVSTKIVPDMISSGYFHNAGYFPHVFDIFNNPKRPVTGIDTYPMRKEYLPLAYRFDKATSLFEYGGGTGNSETDPNRFTIVDWLNDGVANFNFRSAYCFQWSDARDGHFMKAEQKTGIKLAIEALATADKPVPRVHAAKIILPTQNFGTGLSPNYWNLIQGLQKAALLTQTQFPQVAVEMDYGMGGSAADLAVRPVFQNTTIPQEEVFNQKNIYLLYGAGTTVNFGAYNVSAAANAPLSLSILASDQFSIPVGARIMEWTQEWQNGNKNLATNLPTSGAQGYTKLVTSGGHPTVIKVGKSIFISSDLAVAMVNEPNAAPFLAEAIKKLLYGEI